MMDLKEELYKNYQAGRIFITGNTGFKGSWLSVLLCKLNARVYGYALSAESDPYRTLNLQHAPWLYQTIGDVRNYDDLEKAYCHAEPDIVIHLAAQPIVREGYRTPRETYETNVMGTVNLLECMRRHPGVKSFLNVTTDKVYKNPGLSDYAFREEDPLNGFDPYANSKSCSELVTETYARSFFTGSIFVPISTARAGNVIGGGDFAEDRIIPDCVRATMKNEPIAVRNPDSIRPYQHVLDPLMAYLTIAMEQAKDPEKAGSYNIGPDTNDCITTGHIAEMFCNSWGEPARWISARDVNAPHEDGFLRLDSSKLHHTFGLYPVWGIEKAVDKTVQWYRAWASGENMEIFTEKQIDEYLNDLQERT